MGVIAYEVPAGAHNIKVVLRPTPIRRLSAMISSAALGLTLLTAASTIATRLFKRITD
jgi:hypothetical protein